MTKHSTRYFLPLVAATSLLLTACGDTSSAGEGAPPSSSATDAATEAGRGWKPLSDEPDWAPLDAGAYGLTANGMSDHVAVVRAPEGYQKLGGWTFVTDEPFHAMGFVSAVRVPPDPCGS